MLKEYLIEPRTPAQPLEQQYARGADLPVLPAEPEQEPLRSVPVCGTPLQFEVLFCLTGRLLSERYKVPPARWRRRGFSCSPTALLSARVGTAET